MGLMNSIDKLTENDFHHGHRRVYDMEKLVAEIEESRFDVVETGGLKPFGFQMQQMMEAEIIDETQMEGLFRMARKYPEIAGGIFCVARMDSRKTKGAI